MHYRNWRERVKHYLPRSLYWIQCTSTYPFCSRLDNCVENKDTRMHEDGREEVSVEPGCRRGHQRGTCRRMRERGISLRMADRQASASSKQSSVSDPKCNDSLLQLLQYGTSSVQMHHMDPKRFFATLEEEYVQIPLQPSVLGNTNRHPELTSEI